MVWRNESVTTRWQAPTRPSRPREGMHSHRMRVIFIAESDASWHKTCCGMYAKGRRAAKSPQVATL